MMLKRSLGRFDGVAILICGSCWVLLFAETSHGVEAALWIALSIATAAVAVRVIHGQRRPDEPASRLGPYTLDEPIGSGGMGEVWRAHHRLLIRPAAIKLIRPPALGSTPGGFDLLVRRFEREARATAALQSPHTVQLYDFGVANDGTLYYVMELLEGFNLEQLVQRFGPLPAERAVHILVQICCSLVDAHHNGLVHRDIKPANVFVSRVGLAYDFVKVLDFGLVKLDRRHEEEVALGITGEHATPGTPAYMAPEMVLDEPHSDHRVDIYSLGCLAYWLLTGRLVFEERTVIGMMHAHVHTPPRPPSTRGELSIPLDLERIVLDCLEKDPARRPATAVDLAERLTRSALPRGWTAERASTWWSTHVPSLANMRPVAEMLLAHEDNARQRTVNRPAVA